MEQANEILKRVIGATFETSTSTSESTGMAENRQEGKKRVCPQCGGLGFIRRELPVGDPDFGKLFPCICRIEEMEARHASELRAVSNLAGLDRYTFDRFVPQGHGLDPERQQNLQRAYELAREFAACPSGWLILLGSYGCGKTHLSAAIANERIAHNHPALFVNVPDLLDHLRSTYRPGSHVSYDEQFELVRSIPLLILDDLGTEHVTGWAGEKLYQILNHRYNLRLPTVITTNRPLEEIDARLRSRMNDHDLCQIYTILAPDFRGSGRIFDQSDPSSLGLHHDQTFANFYMRTDLKKADERASLRDALKAAQTYAEDPKDWLLFTGGHGSGKTHLAAAIANYRIDQGHRAMFITTADLLDHLRATYSPASPTSYDKRFTEIRTVALLVLDDLGTHSATAWAKEKLYQLFNHRYAARLPTVITTSLTLEELKQQDPLIFSRLIDERRCRTYPLVAPPYTGSRAQEPPAGRQRR